MIYKLIGIGLALMIMQIIGVLGKDMNDLKKQGALSIISSGINQFSSELYEAIVEYEKKEQNFVFSPLSAWMVLSMASSGAMEKTKEQLKSLLHLKDDENFQKLGIETLIEKLQVGGETQLNLASKIFVADSMKLKSEFEKETANTYKSIAQALNFSNSSQASKIINDWVDQQTNSRIQGIVEPDDLSEDTGLVLINAVYFKGNWEIQFNASETRLEPFYLQDGTTKNVSMMHQNGTFKVGYLSEYSAHFIELPYKYEKVEDAISMIVIVPEKNSDFNEFEKNLKNIEMSRLLSGDISEVNLSLPKFKLEAKIDLKSPLTALGLDEIFSDSADFSGMVESPVKVSKIVQKAVIEVNEEGSEAAAVTDVEVENRFGWSDVLYKSINVDHPFIVQICKENVVLFSAKILDPNF